MDISSVLGSFSLTAVEIRRGNLKWLNSCVRLFHDTIVIRATWASHENFFEISSSCDMHYSLIILVAHYLNYSFCCKIRIVPFPWLLDFHRRIKNSSPLPWNCVSILLSFHSELLRAVLKDRNFLTAVFDYPVGLEIYSELLTEF